METTQPAAPRADCEPLRFDQIFEIASPHRAEFIQAFNTAQAQFSRAVKDKLNSDLGNAYADLAGVMEACLPHLLGLGFIVNQTVAYHPGHRQTYLVTKVENADGWRQSCVPLLSLDKGPQAFGSELTYQRRYCLGALMGIAADDDDGNAAADVFREHGDRQTRRERRDNRESRQDRPRQNQPVRQQEAQPEDPNRALAKRIRAHLLTAKSRADIALMADHPDVKADMKRVLDADKRLHAWLVGEIEAHAAKLPA